MKLSALTFSFAVIMATFMVPNKAIALENLSFQAPDTHKENQVIDFLKSETKTPDTLYDIAQVDLNNDAIYEYVIKPQNSKNCPIAPLCPYRIIALQDRKPVLLGEFDAHKILISDKKAYGIRHIIVYNERYNDFKNATAIWNPYVFQYKIP